jgi:AcrR family transcriptional regulator
MNHNIRHRLSAGARRDTILTAAIGLFSGKGFKGTTTRELSRAIGVTEPVLYEHFRTKHELYDAMMDRMAGEGMETFRSTLESASAAGPRAFTRALAHAIVEWFVRHPALIRLLLFSALQGEDISREFRNRAVARVAEAMERYARSNPSKIREDFDPQVAGRALYCLMVQHGLELVLFPGDAPHHQELVDLMADVLINGITS